MAFMDADWIRNALLFVVRFILALGGFAVGYLVTGPVVQLLMRLAFRKTLPDWALAWCKLVGGVAVALLVFWLAGFLGLGGGGGGGKGSGGGTGDGKGPGSGKDSGTMFSGSPNNSKAPGTASFQPAAHQGKLIVEVLGTKTADGDKCYYLYRQAPAVNYDTVKAFLDKERSAIKAMDIVVTDKGASRNTPVVDALFELAKDANLPEPSIIRN
jgi:hypothetical protein